MIRTSNMKLLAVFLVIFSLIGAACSDDKSIGEDIEAKKDGDGNAAIRDPKREKAEKEKAAATTAPPTTAAPVATTAKPATTTTVFTTHIKIQDDEQGEPFSPKDIIVRNGRTVVWTNVGVKNHAVKAEDGAFASQVLKPGQTYTWVANRPGKHLYGDPERPYAGQTASLTVQ